VKSHAALVPEPNHGDFSARRGQSGISS
jgi:hypothetical protein